eukprot:6603802-Karenia_brevis.AAC.1
MTQVKFGVTLEWYEQYKKRLLYQYASFWGEASVHLTRHADGRPVLSQNRLKSKIAKAWMIIRWVYRAWERGLRNYSFRLDQDLKVTIGESFTPYYMHIRRLRAAQAAEKGIDVTKGVLDGHQKLTRPACCVQRVCPLQCQSLGLMTLVGCPAGPARKRKMCARHHAMALRSDPELAEPSGKVCRVQWVAAMGKTVNDLAK